MLARRTDDDDPASKKRRRISSRLLLQFSAALILVVLILLWVSDEMLVYTSLRYFSNDVSSLPPLVPLEDAKIAVVSLHQGFKYHGSLGRFLRNNKLFYARRHGYAYVDVYPHKLESKPLRGEYYKKEAFILYLLEKYASTGLEWILWIDGDAIFTQQQISIEDRVREEYSRKLKANDDMCLVWARDNQPNAGVLLIQNSPTSQNLMRESLITWEDTDLFRRFTDQTSLTVAINQNQTYRECQILLRGDESTLLQSRVRGPRSWRWQPGHWILHLPNHNYLELLSSLKIVGKQLVDDV